jgi:hypothetical protein
VVAVLDQENQQVEDLRLERDELLTAPQLAAVGINGIIRKGKQHVAVRDRRCLDAYSARPIEKSRLPQEQIKRLSKPCRDAARI